MILILLMSFPNSLSQPPKSGGQKLNGHISIQMLYSVFNMPYRSLRQDIIAIILIDVQLNFLKNDLNSCAILVQFEVKLHNC